MTPFSTQNQTNVITKGSSQNVTVFFQKKLVPFGSDHPPTPPNESVKNIALKRLHSPFTGELGLTSFENKRRPLVSIIKFFSKALILLLIDEL